MSDFSEFRRHWRPLLAGSLGVGTALSFNTYLLSIFAPYMIEEFGWSLSQWAMTGLVQFAVMLSIPIAGRLTDLYGVRRVASAGAFTYPLFLLAIAAMNGDINLYLAIYLVQTLVCSTTTMTVYSRVVAGAYSARRGLALGICGSAPPLLGAIASPLMSAFVAGHGWRAGYVAVAAFCMACSIATFLLLKGGDAARQAAPVKPAESRRRGDYRVVLASPVFWILLAALFLVNTPFALASSQLKLVVLGQGLPDSTAALMVSVFAISSIIGRVLSGVALDKLPAHLIAALAFFLPVLGLVLLASPYDSAAAVMTGLVLIGISFGGEGDIIPYLVTRYFRLEIYGTVLGLLTAAMGAAMAAGTALLTATLARSNDYQLYFVVAATTAGIGSAMFLLLGLPRFRKVEESAPQPAVFA
ncbi:MAG: MFS transporter [Novosphingobium sp.]